VSFARKATYRKLDTVISPSSRRDASQAAGGVSLRWVASIGFQSPKQGRQYRLVPTFALWGLIQYDVFVFRGLTPPAKSLKIPIGILRRRTGLSSPPARGQALRGNDNLSPRKHPLAQNRLIEVKDGSTSKFTYTYDAFGRRLAKPKSAQGSTTLSFCYAGGRIIAEYENGVFARKYVYGAGLDEPIFMVDAAGGDR